MARRDRKRPASLREQKNPIHVDGIPRKRQKLYYRIRVVCNDGREGTADYDPGVRDIFIESSKVPQYIVNSGWTCVLCHIALDTIKVTDLMRWLDGLNPVVIYQPPGNMAGHMNPDPHRPDQAVLFS